MTTFGRRDPAEAFAASRATAARHAASTAALSRDQRHSLDHRESGPAVAEVRTPEHCFTFRELDDRPRETGAGSRRARQPASSGASSPTHQRQKRGSPARSAASRRRCRQLSSVNFMRSSNESRPASRQLAGPDGSPPTRLLSGRRRREQPPVAFLPDQNRHRVQRIAARPYHCIADKTRAIRGCYLGTNPPRVDRRRAGCDRECWQRQPLGQRIVPLARCTYRPPPAWRSAMPARPSAMHMPD